MLERPALKGDESVWQAEIMVPKGGTNHPGPPQVFAIRGPPRKTRESAEDDTKRLNEAAPEGAKAVRTIANQLHRGQ